MHKAMLQLLVALILVLGVATAVRATPIAFSTWYEFSFGAAGAPARGCTPADPAGPRCAPSPGTPTTFAPAPPWTFSSDVAVILTVTDISLAGDAFRFFDSGAAVLDTNLVPIGPGCGLDPEICLADPRMSTGAVLLAAASHSLTATAIASPFRAGAGYFRVDPVPEPGTMTLLALGALSVIGHGWRLRRRTA